MPTVSVKQYFQQKPNSYVPTIVTTKPSGSVTASVSYTPAKATISKDVVSISEAAKRAYEQMVSKNQVSNTLTNQVVQPIPPSIPSSVSVSTNFNQQKDIVYGTKKVYQSAVSDNASHASKNIMANKTPSAVIQGVGNKDSGNFEIKVAAGTSTKTTHHVQTVTVQAIANKKSDATDVKTLVKRLEYLEKLTDSYLRELQKNPRTNVSRKPVEINDYNLEFIRYNSKVYAGFKWAITAGTIDERHVQYVESKSKSLSKFFEPNGEGAFLKDPVTGNKIDFLHMAATLDGILSVSPIPDDLSGWAGDLQTAVIDFQRNTNDSNDLKILQKEAKKIIGGNSSFSTSDLLADIDAVNIANMIRENSKLHLSDAIEKYYSKSGEVNRRFSEFIESFGGKKEFKEAVNSVNLKTGPIVMDSGKFEKYGIPTDNQVKAIREAFINHVLNQASKEQK